MIVLQTNKITKSFATDLILSNISIEVQSQDRVALVGRNGAGKSTLLKIITGDLSYDSGEVIKPKETTIGYLAQQADLTGERSIYDEMLTVIQPLVQMEKQLRAMETKMSDPDLLANQVQYQKLLSDYDQLQVSFKDLGGYSYQAEIRGVLHGLNFGGYDEKTPVSHLSGGQKTRLSLGKLLLAKPDLLILDEPTNHLDIDTLTWLENYLQHYPGALLIVSHDRYFLDKIVTKVYEISRHEAKKYTGNYSRYLDEKAAQYEQDLKAFIKQQKEVKELNEFIQRNIVRASTTKRAQSRRKKLEKMDLMDKPKGDEKTAVFSFNVAKQSGQDVLQAKHMTIGYDRNAAIFSDLSLQMTRGESIALVGPNGIGKSTLLKALASQSTLLSGEVSYGSHVSIGYYDQEQAQLTSNKTVLSELWDDYPLTDEKDIRSVLGQFLFSGDDVMKSVSQLSGGEKARLALSKLMMQKDNLLILDEPTNHLDLDSKEVLENALMDFPGTILFVSHDRYFINSLTTRVLELSQTAITEYLGDYDYYVEKKQEMKEIAELEAQASEANRSLTDEGTEREGKSQFERDKEKKRKVREVERSIEKLEQAIQNHEAAIEKLEKHLLDPEVYTASDRALEVHTELNDTKEALHHLVEEWEEQQLFLEDMNGN